MTQEELVEELKHYRYRKLLLNSIDRIARVGYYERCPEEDRLLSCSEEYANIFGLTVEQMLEAESSWKKALQVIHPDDREQYQQISANQSISEAFEFEYRIVRKSGEIRHVREIGVMEKEKHSERILIIGILQDITGLRQQRNALEYREALAQQAESITEIGHFIYNEQLGIYKYISPGFARIFGTTAEEYMNKILSAEDDLHDICPDDLPHVQEVYDRYDEVGEAYSVEYRIFRPDGQLRWVRERCVSYSTENGRIVESLGVMQDITSQKNAEAELLEAQLKLKSTVAELKEEIVAREKVEAELKFLANHDALTGLPSLRLGMDRLERSIAEAVRNNHAMYVLFIDLDGFKRINDRFGHDCGDMVLKKTAQRIKSEIRETDTAARIGGDEFLVILSGAIERKNVEKIAGKLVAGISRKMRFEKNMVGIGASIGIAGYPEDGENAEKLIRLADSAMYRVKYKGKNDFAFIG